MADFKPMVAGEDGWSDWVQPTMARYRMQCCDCGLVHEMQFGVLKRGSDLPGGSWEGEQMDAQIYRVEFRARREDGAN